MDRFYVYILYSVSTDSFYIGQTLNVGTRMGEHLSHIEPDAHTKRADDWNIFYQLECKSRRQAILIEQHIKRMKSRTYLKNLTEFPEMGRKLLTRFF